MTITVKIIADSVAPSGKRLTTMLLRYPRFIHAELMTHRTFSRNASSSRAIPVKKIIADIMADPAMPMHWGKNIPGMQAHEQIDEPINIGNGVLGGNYFSSIEKKKAWLLARDACIQTAIAFDNAGYHKQIVNRLLEPWSHISVLVTATEWNNFFHLRCHEDAQPEIRILADMMKLEMLNSTPNKLVPGQWHMPFITPDDVINVQNILKTNRITRDEPKASEVTELLLHISTARCARTSYLLHDGTTPDIQKDLGLFERLVGSQPLHASPTEHQATPDEQIDDGWLNEDLHGNFNGWIQFRKSLPGEFYPG